MYEYQEHAFTRTCKTTKRHLKHWFIPQPSGYLSAVWNTRTVVCLSDKHATVIYVVLYRSAFPFPRQREKRGHIQRKKSQGEKLDANISIVNGGPVIISLCARKCHSLRCLSQKAGTKERVIARCVLFLPQTPLLPTSNLTRSRISPNHPRLLLFFLSSSLNYWKQNGLRTKTQADVGWLIMPRHNWRPYQMKTVQKNYYRGRYVAPAVFLSPLAPPPRPPIAFLLLHFAHSASHSFLPVFHCSGISPKSYQILPRRDKYLQGYLRNRVQFFSRLQTGILKFKISYFKV